MKPVNESTLKAAIERIETTRRNLGDISIQEEWNLEVYKELLHMIEQHTAWQVTFTQVGHESNTFTKVFKNKADVNHWRRLHERCGFKVTVVEIN